MVPLAELGKSEVKVEGSVRVALACGGEVPGRLRWLYLALVAGAVLLTAYSAWLGGRMVYGQGIGVF